MDSFQETSNEKEYDTLTTLLDKSSLFQAFRQWGRRERKWHAKSWRGEKEEKEAAPALPSFLPFYFRLRAFSIQRARLEQAKTRVADKLVKQQKDSVTVLFALSLHFYKIYFSVTLSFFI